jgi:hypothetical protein
MRHLRWLLALFSLMVLVILVVGVVLLSVMMLCFFFDLSPCSFYACMCPSIRRDPFALLLAPLLFKS